MKLLGPTKYPRLNEGTGFVFLLFSVALICALVSYHPLDRSWNTATSGDRRPVNLIGPAGAFTADLLLQAAGLGAFTVPALLLVLAWRWFLSKPIEAQFFKTVGAVSLVLGVCTAFSLGPEWRPFSGTITVGGLVGRLLADWLVSMLNPLGAVLTTGSVIVRSG